MDKRLHEIIDNSVEEYFSILKRWVRIPSVAVKSGSETEPFGHEVALMKAEAEKTLRDMSIRVLETGPLVTEAVIGDSGEDIAVMGHLDVVPAGEGWHYPPFDCTEHNGRIYGRGTVDDKGAALAVIFALRALRMLGLPWKNRVRLVFGYDEEASDIRDMYEYFKKTGTPEIGICADSTFPLVYSEFGILVLGFSAPVCRTGLEVLRFKCGTKYNVIPGMCRALVRGGGDIADRVSALASMTGGPCSAEVTDEGVWITTQGIAGHGALPEGKRNALTMMLVLLRALGAQGAVAALAEAVGMETNARGLGCAFSSEEYGSVVCNLGVLEKNGDEWRGTLDLRLPYTVDADETEARVKAHLPGFEIKRIGVTPSSYVKPDDPLCQELMAAFEEESGMRFEPIKMSGGTYAKIFRRGIAYGPYFQDDEATEHQADENMRIDRMLMAIKIYANAFSRLLL